MTNATLLKELASRVLEVDVDAPDEEIERASRDKSSSWHPDVSDDPEATDKFIAAQAARDVLLGEVDYGDPDSVNNARRNLSNLFTDDEVQELERETGGQVGYSSEAETRSDPTAYSREDFATAGTGEKRQMMKTIALGVETVIIYNAVEGMYEMGYGQDDFFKDVNNHIGEADRETIDFDDYFQATKENLRDEVTEALFINSCEKIQDNLQDEYGQGTNIREVARIVSHFMVQGGITIGNLGRFVGRGSSEDNSPFTRDHPLGRHGGGRRSSSNFTRGDDRYTR